MRVSRLLFAVALLTGCVADAAGFDPEASPGLEGALAQGKADGAFGSTEISIWSTVAAETGGDGLVLYSIQLDAADQIRVTVDRTSGDLRPSAYLYEGISTFVRPDDYEVTDGRVILDFTIGETTEHFIVVRAHNGTGNGEFSMTVECTGGPCAGGSSLTGIARADQCLTRAADCALRELPRYDGAVGPARAQTLLDECLAAEGADCADACDAAPELGRACTVILETLPDFADQSRGCLVEMSYCLDQCSEYNGYGYGDDTEYLQTPTCWDGHQGQSSSATGHCLDYAYGLVDCGGDSYEGDTLEGCYALCENTEGAWDEGPFDGCEDSCRDH